MIVTSQSVTLPLLTILGEEKDEPIQGATNMKRECLTVSRGTFTTPIILLRDYIDIGEGIPIIIEMVKKELIIQCDITEGFRILGQRTYEDTPP